jgi:hypothetical protein
MTVDHPVRFTSPQECIEAMLLLHKARGYGRTHIDHETQVRCKVCGRWKYNEERCSLFWEVGAPKAAMTRRWPSRRRGSDEALL